MTIFRSRFPDITIPGDKNLPELLLENYTKHAAEGKTILIDGATDRTLTYAQLLDTIPRVASALARRGVQKGTPVFFYSPNHFNYALGVFGTVFNGAVVTTCNPLYTTRELLHQFKDTHPKHILTTSAFVPKVREAEAELEGHSFEHIILLDDAEVDGCEKFSELLNDSGDLYKHPSKLGVQSEDTAFILYSSGTTGPSKGVMISHYNVVANTLQFSSRKEYYDYISEDGNPALILFLPMFHAYGLLALLFMTTSIGSAKLVIMEKFDFVPFLTLATKHKASVLYIVPPIAVALAKHPIVDKFDLSGTGDILCAAASLGKETAEAVMKRIKVKRGMIQGWGMTELSPVGTISPVVGWKYGSSGILLVNTEAKIVDISDNTTALGINERGELWIRGPQVMKGYHNNPEATARTIDSEGWLHTGDIAYFDEDEQLFIVDRLKELIKYKGFQVPPAELEELLLSHTAVADACVIGILDDDAGELPRAYVTLKQDQTVTESDIQAFVADKVAPHKKLRGGVVFIDQIPKSASGKLLRRQLRDKARAEVEAAKTNGGH